MDYSSKVDTAAAEHAFDQLASDGPRVVSNALRSLATTAAATSSAKAPGRMRGRVRVHDVSQGDVVALFYGPDDVAIYGPGTRVGWWTSKGTYRQKPRRFLKKLTSRQKDEAVHKALLRAARRAGFDTSGGA
jgi:hypothetical protein